MSANRLLSLQQFPNCPESALVLSADIRRLPFTESPLHYYRFSSLDYFPLVYKTLDRLVSVAWRHSTIAQSLSAPMSASAWLPNWRNCRMWNSWIKCSMSLCSVHVPPLLVVPSASVNSHKLSPCRSHCCCFLVIFFFLKFAHDIIKGLRVQVTLSNRPLCRFVRISSCLCSMSRVHVA